MRMVSGRSRQSGHARRVNRFMKTATTTPSIEKAVKNGDLVPVTLSELVENMKRHKPLFFWSPVLWVSSLWNYHQAYEEQVGMD
jgi:hypothetical protein